MARAHRYEMLPHVHALLALVEQADAPEPAKLCRGDASVLDGLADPGESWLVRVVGAELRSRGIP